MIRKYSTDITKETMGIYEKIGCTIQRDFRYVTMEKKSGYVKLVTDILKKIRFLLANKLIV